MPSAKDRTDPVAQIIAAEAITMALAKVAYAMFGAQQKKDFEAAVTTFAQQICDEITAQAPAIGRARGLSADAANASAARISRDAMALAAAHIQMLIGAPADVSKH